jgi:Transposase DDE domain
MRRINEHPAKIAEFLEKAMREVLKLHEKSMHQSRLSFLELVIPAIIAAKSVQYHRIAAEMGGDVQEASKEKRIQRFIVNYNLEEEFVYLFLIFLLPKKGKVTLCIDRTTWEFGGCTHNLLTVTAYSHGVGVPIWVESVAQNGGCCDVDDKLYVIMKSIEMLGRERIKCVIGDSEFIGEEWILYLWEQKIRFFFDIRSNQYFEYKGKSYTVRDWMRGRYKSELKEITIFGKTLNIGIKRQKMTKNMKKKPFLAVVTNCTTTSGILGIYKNRWSIEVFFQSLKGRGFDMESTHLDNPIEMRRMFMLLCMAFILCLRVGLEVNKVSPIPVKNHGYKANSFFRTGRNFISCIFKQKSIFPNIDAIMIVLNALFVTILNPKSSSA